MTPEQIAPETTAGPPAHATPARVPLGKLAVDRGLINQMQLADVFAEQLATGRRLGEILCSRGFISEHDLEQLLAVQRETRFEGAVDPAAPPADAVLAPAEEPPAPPATGASPDIDVLIEEIERQAQPFVAPSADHREAVARAERAEALLRTQQRTLIASSIQLTEVTAELESVKQERVAHAELELTLDELLASAERRAREDAEHRRQLDRLKALFAAASG